MYEKVNVLEYEVKNENNTLSAQKDALAKDIETISFEETEKQFLKLVNPEKNKLKINANYLLFTFHLFYDTIKKI